MKLTRLIGEDKIRFRFFVSLFVIFPVFLFAQSPSEKRNLEKVIRYLREFSIPFEERPLLAGYGGFGSSVLVRNPASGENADTSGTFVLAVPLNANFAVDTAVALAKTLRERKCSTTIIIAFLGDENNPLSLSGNSGGMPHKGLRDLLTLVDMPENWVLCYFDAGETPDKIVIRHGTRNYMAPLEIIKALPSFFDAHEILWSFEIRYNEIYKLGLVEGPPALQTTWGEEINGFVLSGGNKNQKGTDSADTAPEETSPTENLAELLLDYAGSLNLPILKADRHYSYLPLPGGKGFFAGEGFITALAMIMAAVFLFASLVYSGFFNAKVLFHIRLFVRHIWIFFILLPLLVLSIRISGLLYSGLFLFFDALPDFPNYAGAGLTIVLAALIFFLPSPVLDLTRFSGRARFYGFSAVVFIAAGTLSAAVIDFSYTLIFLWAFFFVFVGAVIPNPATVFLCVFLAPVFALAALINIIETGSDRIVELFISPHWHDMNHWIIAFEVSLFSLPLLLLVKRGIILVQKSLHKGRELKPNRKYRMIFIPVSIIVVLGIMILQISAIPKNTVTPQRRFLALDSETQEPEILKVNREDTLFQDSRIIKLNMEARKTPLRFNVSLESVSGENLLPVYSSPVPFEKNDREKRLDFILGDYPKNPLTLEIAVPREFNALLRVEAVYNNPEPSIDPEEKPDTGDYVFTVSKSIELGITNETRQ